MTSAETTESYEICYNVLHHILLVVNRGARSVFEQDFKRFFVKYEEPSYVKFAKLDILTGVASEQNLAEIAAELNEYVTDVNAEIAKKSIQSFGNIMVNF